VWREAAVAEHVATYLCLRDARRLAVSEERQSLDRRHPASCGLHRKMQHEPSVRRPVLGNALTFGLPERLLAATARGVYVGARLLLPTRRERAPGPTRRPNGPDVLRRSVRQPHRNPAGKVGNPN